MMHTTHVLTLEVSISGDAVAPCAKATLWFSPTRLAVPLMAARAQRGNLDKSVSNNTNSTVDTSHVLFFVPNNPKEATLAT
jgi:hypothetical protein